MKSGMLEHTFTRISAIMEIDGETLAEIPLGDDSVQLGYFYRVYDNESNQIKATLQVTELLGDKRAVGTVLHTNNDLPPIAVNDKALYLRDISTLFDARNTTNQAKDAAEMLNKEQQQTQEEFQALRNSYQEQLNTLHAEHEAQIARLQEAQQTEIALLNEHSAIEINRLKQERTADLQAINANFENRVAQEVKKRERLSRQHVKEVTAERDRLRVQLDRLMKTSQSQKNEISRIIQEQQKQSQKHEETILAELETRNILEERVRVLESALRGQPTSKRPVLPTDMGRKETVLDRLQRLQNENNRMAAQVQVLSQDNKQLSQENTQHKATAAQLGRQLKELQESEALFSAAQATADEQATTLASLQAAYNKQRMDALSAEKNFFQLAKHILSLPSQDTIMTELKVDVMHRIEEMKNQ